MSQSHGGKKEQIGVGVEKLVAEIVFHLEPSILKSISLTNKNNSNKKFTHFTHAVEGEGRVVNYCAHAVSHFYTSVLYPHWLQSG